jgi:methylaspartate mutase sigma subunit
MSGARGHDVAEPSGPVARVGGRTVVVSSMASDSHTWNLVFLQLLIEEFDVEVVNLGPCVPDDLLVAECRERLPAAVVISSVNGHGYQDGLRVIARLRALPGLVGVPIVIGGKLGVHGRTSVEHIRDLLDAGFDAVYDDRADETASFRGLVAALARAADRELR